MIPILYYVIAFALAKLLISAFKSDPQLRKIKPENIYNDFLIKYRKKKADVVIKRKITTNINIIINEFDYFKIGKTGNFKKRAKNYIEFDHMFILLETTHPEIIIELEDYYNIKFITHSKNENINIGSAGKTVSANGKYYLYIAVA